MTWERNVDRALENWLVEGPNQLPDRVVDSIVQQLEQTNRRGPWLPGRTRMNRMVLSFGGIAAIVLVLLGTGALYVGMLGNGPGIPGGNAPTPTAAPTAMPTGTPSPRASSTAMHIPETDFLPLAPGQYVASTGTHSYAATVPAGYMSYGGGNMMVTGSNLGAFQTDFAASPDFGWLSLPTWWLPADIAEVYTDPCHKQTSAHSTGQSAAELANALRLVTPMNPTTPEDVTMSGLQGKHIVLTVPTAADFTKCDLGQYWSLSGRFYQVPGQVDEFWIIDLGGTDRAVFNLSYRPGTPQTTKDQLRQMVQSMTIEPSTL